MLRPIGMIDGDYRVLRSLVDPFKSTSVFGADALCVCGCVFVDNIKILK